MMNKNIKPGLNGLPPVKDQYDENEKKQIVEAAEEHDLKSVAKAYGLTWQKVRSWRTRLINAVMLDKEPKTSQTTPTAAQSTPQKAPQIIIQSPSGQEITTNDILEKVGNVDSIYVRVDENAAYWVKGEEHGSVQLW